MSNRLTAPFLLLLGILLFACTPSDQSASFDVPELLDRSAAIQLGKEWENVANRYGTARAGVAQQPDAWGSYLTLAEVFMNEARVTGEHGHYYPAALRTLDHVLEHETEPTDERFRALSLKASVQLSQHEFEPALETALAAARINPYNAQVHGAITDAYVEMGDYPKAIAAAEQMTKIRPDLRSYSRISYLREIHGDVEGAIQAMEMAVAAGIPHYEETAWARLTLGDLYKEYGMLAEAEGQYRTILQYRPNYPFAVAALGDVEMEKGNFKEAELLIGQSMAIIPEVGFYEQMAHLYQETGREQQALEMLDEIYVMLEDDVQSGHNMNMEYARLHLELTKDYDQALQYAKHEQVKRPDNIDVNRLLALIHHARGEGDDARRHAQLAARTNSQHPELLEINRLLAEG